MKIGVYLEGYPKMGGGFFQSLKSSLLFFDIKNYSNIELIITHIDTKKYLEFKNINNRYFNINFVSKYFSELFEIDFFNDLFNKLKIRHPFYKFIKKNQYDIIIFLGPSQMSKFCNDISFISNIWDLDHKKNSQFPEHNRENIYASKEKLIKDIVSRAFRIIVPHKMNKEDLMNFYKASDKEIIVQNFIPMLPTIFKENFDSVDYNKIFSKLNLPKNKKIIFYPAQFWAHKNHKYIIDVIKILKLKNIDDYFFVFCGSDKGNQNYIKKLVSDNNLDNYVRIFNFLDDNQVISLYLNCDALVMPTYCGPTNLPIYEAFFFKKIIFYSKDLIKNDPINDAIIPIDLNNPIDFFEKLQFINHDDKVDRIVKKNHKMYFELCNEEKIKNNYKKILDDFFYLRDRWN